MWRGPRVPALSACEGARTSSIRELMKAVITCGTRDRGEIGGDRRGWEEIGGDLRRSAEIVSTCGTKLSSCEGTSPLRYGIEATSRDQSESR